MTRNIVESLGRWGAPVFEELGLSLYDIEVTSGRVVVMVDRPDGVSLDVIARCTRALSAILDEKDPIGGRYTLEVSSPGLERRLRTIDHRRGAIGEVVKCKSRDAEGVVRRIDGVVVEVDDDTMVIDTDQGRVAVPHDEVLAARTVFVWPDTKHTKRPGDEPSGSHKARAEHDKVDK